MVMKFDPRKFKSLSVSRSRSELPPHPLLYADGDQIQEKRHLKVFGVVLDSKPLMRSTCLFTECRPISITPVISKVFERLVEVRLQRYLEACANLPSRQFAYRKKLGTCDALLTICQMGQQAFGDGGELSFGPGRLKYCLRSCESCQFAAQATICWCW